MVTVEEVDTQIRELKGKIKELQKVREQAINETTLFPEGQEFVDKGWEASEALRRRDPALYYQKCIDAGFRKAGERWGVNICHHRSKWEGTKIKACWHASHGRAKYAKHLTEEELKYAKIYAKAYTKEWVEFWEGSVL